MFDQIDKALAELKRIVESISSEFDLARIELDRIVHLTVIGSDFLPRTFIKLVESADSDFYNTDLELLRSRLVSSLEMHEKYPPTNDAIGHETDLLPTFSLSKKDAGRVIKLCDQMRKIVHASDAFDVPHKKRLLNRIAAIEKQVYSTKGLFDVVLGGVSDFGEAMGKFGNDIKPLTDRMAEVRKITRSGSGEYQQLGEPEETKALPAPYESEEE